MKSGWMVAGRMFLGFVFCLGVLVAQDPAAIAPELTGEVDVELRPFQALITTQPLPRLNELATSWVERVRMAAEGEALSAAAPQSEPSAVVIALVERAVVVAKALGAAGGDEKVVTAHLEYLSRVGGDAFSSPSALLSKAQDWLLDPSGGIKWGINLVLFLVTLVVFSVLGRILGSVVRRGLKRFRSGSQLLQDFFVNTTIKVVSFVGLVIALPLIGVPTGPFVAALGAATFVIGFALQGTLSNFAAGIMILLYRPYDLGDYVKIAGVEGTVKAMSLVSTTLATPDNQVVVVPNGSIWGGVITNVTGNPTRRVDLVFGVSYGDDMTRAKAILQGIVKEHALVLAEPAPVVQVHQLADSSVNIVCRPWTKTKDYWAVHWDLIRQAKEAFDEAGITIPFPQRDIHVFQHGPQSDGSSAPALPAS